MRVEVKPWNRTHPWVGELIGYSLRYEGWAWVRPEGRPPLKVEIQWLTTLDDS